MADVEETPKKRPKTQDEGGKMSVAAKRDRFSTSRASSAKSLRSKLQHTPERKSLDDMSAIRKPSLAKDDIVQTSKRTTHDSSQKLGEKTKHSKESESTKDTKEKHSKTNDESDTHSTPTKRKKDLVMPPSPSLEDIPRSKSAHKKSDESSSRKSTTDSSDTEENDDDKKKTPKKPKSASSETLKDVSLKRPKSRKSIHITINCSEVTTDSQQLDALSKNSGKTRAEEKSSDSENVSSERTPKKKSKSSKDEGKDEEEKLEKASSDEASTSTEKTKHTEESKVEQVVEEATDTPKDVKAIELADESDSAKASDASSHAKHAQTLDVPGGDKKHSKTRERSFTRDETSSPRRHKAHTRDRSATKEDVLTLRKKSSRGLIDNEPGTESASSDVEEEAEEGKKKRLRSTKSKGTLRHASISGPVTGSIPSLDLTSVGQDQEGSPHSRSALASTPVDSPRVSDPSIPPPPPLDGIPAPPPPPGKGYFISKKSIPEPESTRKVLTRIATPKIDEELDAWDRKFPDYEDFVNSKRVLEDPLCKDVLLFPENDVVVSVTKRDVGKLPQPDSDTPRWVKDALTFFTNDLKRVTYANTKYGGRLSLAERLKEKEERDLRAKADEKKIKVKDKKQKLAASNSGSMLAQERPSSPSGRGSVSHRERPARASISELQRTPSELGKKESKTRAQRRGSSTGLEEEVESSEGSSSRSSNAPQPFALHEPLLQLDENIHKEMRNKRESRMHCIFDKFSSTNISSEPTESRVDVGPLTPPPGVRILVHGKQFNVPIGVEDAFFFSVAFYDIEKQLKITEDFHFDFNDDNELIKTLLAAHATSDDEEAKAKRALFNLSYTSENIYLVVRVSTILKGDIDDVAEPYTPGHALSLNQRQKWIDFNRQAASTLGRYKQGFAWGAVPVFDASGSLILEKESKILLYKMKNPLTDDVLFEIMNSEEKHKRMKQLDVALVLGVSLYKKSKYHLKKVYDPSLILIPNFDDAGSAVQDEPKKKKDKEGKDKSKTIISEPVKLIHEFYQPFHKPYPYTSYINNLYVYPLEIAFNTQKIKVKSVIARVYLLPSEGVPDNEALQMAFAQNSFENFAKCVCTTVVFNDKNPTLYDEIKFKLPLSLHEKYHLFFAFYSVDTKVLKPEKRAAGQTAVETIIGYCALPIFQDKVLIKDKEYILPIDPPSSTNTYTDYLGHTPKPIDPEKIYFRFRTQLVSSVYTNDEHLATFFSKVHNRKTEQELLIPLDHIPQVNNQVLMHFAPIVMNQLFVSLCRAKTEAAGSKIFMALMDVASRVFNLTMTSGRVTISEPLFSYVLHHFDNSHNVHEALARAWVSALKLNAKLDPDVQLPREAERARELVFLSTKELSWFLLELLYKSMVLALDASGDLQKEDARKTRFSASYKQSLNELIKLSDVYRKKNPSGFDFVSRNYALFLMDLLRIHDRGHVIDLINTYVSQLGNDNVQASFRYRILSILSDFEHYIPFNLPVETPIDSIDKIDLRFWKTHWLAGLYVHELNNLLKLEEAKLTRTKAVARFRDLIWKHAIDERYQSKAIMTRIAGIYFPLLVICVEKVQAIQKTINEKNKDDTEIREWAIIILWILQNCNRDLHLRSWWSRESEQYLLQFIQLLKLCLDTFVPEDGMREDAILILMDIFDYFMDDFTEEMSTEGSKIYESFAQLLLHCLRVAKTEKVMRTILEILRNFIIKFRKPLFRYLTNYSYLSDLSYEILNLCHSQPRKVVRDATTIFYLLLRTNSDEMGHFARMKLQSTLAISRLAKNDKCHFDELQQSLESLGSYKDPKVSLASWQSQVRELVTRHCRIIRDSLRIAQVSDVFSDHKAELYYKVSLEYVNSPDLRITWLNNLSAYHEKMENYEEAAHCKVQIASLIAEYLTRFVKPKVKGLPEDRAQFARISPNVASEKGLSVLWLEGASISPDFSEDGFTKALTDAINLFVKVENYESAIESYLILSRYYNDNRKYQNLTTCAKELATLSDKVYAANRAQSRIPPNFYRVGFYGEGFGEDNGKEFIYRESPSMRLADFTTAMTKRYEDMFGSGNFELLKNIVPIEEVQLDPKKNYLQIVAVDIYYDFDELNTRELSYTDRSFNARKFVYENPYSPDGGKISEDPAKSWKRKNILTTVKACPHMLKRIEVCKKETKILSPLESAIDVIQSIVVRLKQCLNCTPPNVKTLQIILQGAILTQVNAGPLAILEVFVGNQSQYPANLIEILKDQFRAFLRSSQFGIRLNESLVATQPEFAPLQEAIKEAFAKLQKKAVQYNVL